MSATIRRKAALSALISAMRSSRGPGVPTIGERLGAVPRMLGAGLSGRYPHLDRRRVVLAVLALIYIVSPIDVLPEAFLLIFGLGDDALVTAWVAGAMLSETDAFLAWERAQNTQTVRVIRGEVLEHRSTES